MLILSLQRSFVKLYQKSKMVLLSSSNQYKFLEYRYLVNALFKIISNPGKTLQIFPSETITGARSLVDLSHLASCANAQFTFDICSGLLSVYFWTSLSRI